MDQPSQPFPHSYAGNSYLYGGLRPNGVNINGSTSFDDVYILSIPAFVWVKWYPQTTGASAPHHSLTCDIINGTQMIVMGGTFPDSSACDVPYVAAQHNLNLGQNNPANSLWSAFVLDFPPYIVPPAITQLIGGTLVPPPHCCVIFTDVIAGQKVTLTPLHR